MNKIEKLLSRVNQFIEDEQNMERKLDELEDSAVTAEQGSLPELTRILLLHANIIRAILERSRRRWMRLSVALSIVVVGCLVLLIFATR